jgi:hypothetical protein
MCRTGTQELKMTAQATTAALERLEGLAADFLEAKINDVEKSVGVTVKEIEVAVVPDTHGDGPLVNVVVSI